MTIPRAHRLCQEPGCPDLAEPRRSRCAAHQRARTREHNIDHAAYHTAEYRQARAEQLTAFAFCFLELTAPTGCSGTLTYHHLDHDRTNNRPVNRATLCERHHMQLEREHQTGTRRELHQALERALPTIRRNGWPASPTSE